MLCGRYGSASRCATGLKLEDGKLLFISKPLEPREAAPAAEKTRAGLPAR